MTVGIFWEHRPCPSSPHEDAIERVEITDAGPFALDKYISSSIERQSSPTARHEFHREGSCESHLPASVHRAGGHRVGDRGVGIACLRDCRCRRWRGVGDRAGDQDVAYIGIAPVVGAYADRLPRKGLLVVMDLVRAGVALVLPFVVRTSAYSAPSRRRSLIEATRAALEISPTCNSVTTPSAETNAVVGNADDPSAWPRTPWASRKMFEEASPSSRRKSVTRSASSPWLISKTGTSRFSSATCASIGISRRHGPHHVAHRLMTNGRPRNESSATDLPSRRLTVSETGSGLGGGCIWRSAIAQIAVTPINAARASASAVPRSIARRARTAAARPNAGEKSPCHR